MNKFAASLLLSIALLNAASSQNIGINETGATPDATAILDISATDKGVLIPRTDTTTVNATGTPATGLLIYQNSDNIFYYFDGSKWVGLTSTGDHNTLDDAYDEGGNGNGRIIMADNGAVEVQGGDGLFVGTSNSATGRNGFIVGRNNTNSANHAGIIGFYNTVRDSSVLAIGAYNLVDAPYSLAVGYSDTITGIGRSLVAGGSNRVGGANDMVAGSGNTVTGHNNLVSGSGNEVTQHGNLVVGNSHNNTSSNTIIGGTGHTNSGESNAIVGSSNTVSGGYNIVGGGLNTISGSYSALFGTNNTLTGTRAMVVGIGNTAPSAYETVIGSYSTQYTATSAAGFNSNDRVFTIGNGQGTGSRSNAMTVYKSGYVNINDAYTLPNADGVSGQVMTTDGAGNLSWATAASSADTLPLIIDADRDTYIHTEENADEDFIRFTLGGTEYYQMTAARIQFQNADLNIFAGRGAGNETMTGQRNVSFGISGLTNTTTGGLNTAVGDRSLLQVTTGSYNVGIGSRAGMSTQDGNYNVAIGRDVLYFNTSGSHNVAIGNGALYNVNSSGSVAIGYRAGGVSGGRGVFIGYNAGVNETGSNKLYIENTTSSTPLIWGDFANDSLKVYGVLGVMDSYVFPTTDGSSGQVMTTDGAGNLSWATAASSADTLPLIIDADRDTYIHTEENADEDFIRFRLGGTEHFRMNDARLDVLNSGKSVFIGENAGAAASYIADFENIAIGYNASAQLTTAWGNIAIGSEANNGGVTVSENIAIGPYSLSSSTVGYNVAIGPYAGNQVTTAGYNIFIGNRTGTSLVTGNNNTAVGNGAFYFNISGGGNTLLGTNSAYTNQGSYNTMVGTSSGFNNINGNRNVFLGYNAGYSESGSEKLYIENTNSSTPLIWGDFANDSVKIYGTLGVQDAYVFPNVDGTSAQVMTTDGAGNLSWADAAGDNLGDHVATANIQLNDNWLSNDGGSEGVYVTSTGKVGVGTSTPAFGFEAFPGVDSSAHIGKAHIGAVGNGFNWAAFAHQDYANDTSYALAQNGGGSTIINAPSNQEIMFRINHSNVARIDANGNVGIGTTNPLEKLDVSGNATVDQLNINDNYTFPITDGSSGQVLTTDGAGVVSWTTVSGSGNLSEIVDADGDTKIQVEESADEDIIRFDMAGTEYFVMESGRISVVNANDNISIGDQAGVSLAGTGLSNTFVGTSAGSATTTGDYNAAFGYQALLSNTGGTLQGNSNNAFGAASLLTNSTGRDNSAFGRNTLSSSTTGSFNTAMGNNALTFNRTGEYNTALGYRAMYGDATSGENNYCTALGYQALMTTNLTNSMALGYNADATASNQVRVGNNSVTSIGGYANWTNLSDGRFKTNIKEDIVGLDFIMKLRPVSYQIDMDALGQFQQLPDSNRMVESESIKNAEVQTGFIAQEVEQAAKDVNFNFHGIDAPQNEQSHYGLRYAEFVVPMVKAMQEQQQIIETQEMTIEELKRLIQQQQQQIDAIRAEMQNN